MKRELTIYLVVVIAFSLSTGIAYLLTWLTGTLSQPEFTFILPFKLMFVLLGAWMALRVNNHLNKN